MNKLVTGIKLYLVQRGEAHPKNADPERTRTDQGKADIVCLELCDDAHWQLNWMIRPDLLK